MKLSKCLTIGIFAFLSFEQAFASCEGAGISNLRTAWYDTVSHYVVKEQGYEGNTEFLVQTRDATESFLSSSFVVFPKDDGGQNLSFSGKAYVDIRTEPNNGIQPFGHEPLVFADDLKNELAQKNLLILKKEYPPEDVEQAYINSLKAVHDMFSSKENFVDLRPLEQCPYILEGRRVYKVDTEKKKRPIGRLIEEIPGDYRTATTVDKNGTCWGYKDKVILISFHWDWECQGEGDVTYLIQGNKGK